MWHRMKRCGGNLRVGLFALRPPPKKGHHARERTAQLEVSKSSASSEFFPSIFRNEPKCLSLELTWNRAVGTCRGRVRASAQLLQEAPVGPPVMHRPTVH